MTGEQVMLPLGLLSVMGLSDQPERARSCLQRLRNRLEEEPERVASYLRRGTILLAIMEQTDDLLAGGFTVAGGSGIASDGRFFWRVDAADYVEHYSIGLPSNFLEHARARAWEPPILNDDEVRRADAEVDDFFRASFDDALWPDALRTDSSA